MSAKSVGWLGARNFAISLTVLLMISLSSVATPSDATSTRDIELAFAGDIHFEEQLRQQGAAGGLQPFKPLLGSADISMLNLETALTTRGKPANKTYTFRANPEVLTTLTSVGVDVVTMANNHAFDYGTTYALADTLRARKNSSVAVVGVGANQSDAIKPFIKSVRGTSFAFFAFDDFWVLSNWPAKSDRAGMAVWANHKQNILRQIKFWSNKVDVISVYVHWGYEYQTCPTSRQKSIARQLAEAGADIVVGSHPHVLQGIGKKSGALVAYSLGNFSWYGHAFTESGVLKVTIRNKKIHSYSLVPTMYDKTGLPFLATGARLTQFRNHMLQVNKCDDLV